MKDRFDSEQISQLADEFLEIAKKFMAEGLNVYFVELSDKDPNELGYKKITEKLEDTYQFSFERMMELKIDSLWK